MLGPSITLSPTIVTSCYTGSPVLPGCHVPPRRTAQRSLPAAHPRQPDKPWCSSRPGTSRWFAGPFSGRPSPVRCTPDSVRSWLLTPVLSKATSSYRTRRIHYFYKVANTRSSTAPLAQQFFRRIDRMPVADALGQSPPLATVLSHVENSVEHLPVGNADFAPLYR